MHHVGIRKRGSAMCGPNGHQPAPLIEQIAALVSSLDSVCIDVRQGCLNPHGKFRVTTYVGHEFRCFDKAGTQRFDLTVQEAVTQVQV